MQVKWLPTEDRGPNGADGKAMFDPIISVALIVSLYQVQCVGVRVCVWAYTCVCECMCVGVGVYVCVNV